MLREKSKIDRDYVLMYERREKRASQVGRELIELLRSGESVGHPIRSGSWLHVPVIKRRNEGAKGHGRSPVSP